MMSDDEFDEGYESVEDIRLINLLKVLLKVKLIVLTAAIIITTKMRKLQNHS